jgi:hypothetical protein
MTNRKPTRTKPPIGSTAQVGAGQRPVVGDENVTLPSARASDSDVAQFIAKMKTMAPVAAAGRGRLIFAMDATMSRARGLDVQLVYFRGMGECRVSKWVSNPDALARLMTSVACRGGLTQIGKVLKHAIEESGGRKVNALVYVGDCMEEDIDRLCARAGELALLGVPVFLFQEGEDARAERAFREIARLTNGAFCRFDRGSARQLRELLTAVAVYAAGGHKALLALSSEHDGAGARRLLAQLKPPGH